MDRGALNWNNFQSVVLISCFISLLCIGWVASVHELADLKQDTVKSVYPFFGPRLQRFEFINYTKLSNENKTIQYTIVMRPKLTWIEAAVSCACHCGTLVDIQDDGELELVNKMILKEQDKPFDLCDTRNHQVWVGALSLNRAYRRFFWYATEQLVQPFVWGKGKPEIYGYKGEVWPAHCGAMKREYFSEDLKRQYLMNDEPCNWQQFPYICKWSHQSDTHDREKRAAIFPIF